MPLERYGVLKATILDRRRGLRFRPSMTEKQPADAGKPLASASESSESWAEPKATALLVLAGWTVVGVVLAVRGFSWEARRD